MILSCSASPGVSPSRGTMKAFTFCMRRGSFTPMTQL